MAPRDPDDPQRTWQWKPNEGERLVALEGLYTGVRDLLHSHIKATNAELKDLNLAIGSLRTIIFGTTEKLEDKLSLRIAARDETVDQRVGKVEEANLKFVSNRLPNWAVTVMIIMSNALGLMIMYIAQHH